MKVNLGIVKQYTDLSLGVNELVEKVNAQLGGVEEVLDFKAKYKDARVVRVVSCEKHANADKLSVCMVDAGGKELVKVVCGAPNVHADMWAIWLPPASVVPSSFGDEKPFVLDAREIRGEMSHGMLAAADELGIGSDHSGIIELHDTDIAPEAPIKSLKPGLPFAEVFGLNEQTIDIENKMFTHRPDLFGQLGVAREIAGIQNRPFVSPEWYNATIDSPKPDAQELTITVTNSAASAVPRFVIAAMNNIAVRPSPMWLQCALVAMGAKPINNVVDITNYIMLLTAQPTHAYDYDTLEGGKISARMATKTESVKLLNGKTYQLTPEDIVIADGSGPIGLAGIMGGLETEVTERTKNIVLEVANFDMYTVRKSSMKHGLFTDALTRFNKGQSPYQNIVVMNRLITLITGLCGGELASSVFDEGQKLSKISPVKTTTTFVNERLGSNLTAKEMASLLTNVEFVVTTDSSSQLEIVPPFWRTDIDLQEDVVEEIGRLYGFDNLPHNVPLRPTIAAPKNQSIETKQFIRENMKHLGVNELLTYSFVHERVIKRAEQDINEAFTVYNALSPDLQFYRLSVLPSLLDKVHANIKAGHDSFVLYEIGKGHNKQLPLNTEGLPDEQRFVDVVLASKKALDGAPFYAIRQYAEELLSAFGARIVCKSIDTPLNDYVTAPFDQSRSALVETTDGLFVGIVGELKHSVVKNFKLPAYTAAMSLDFKALQTMHESRRSTYVPLSRYPSITQDISLRVPSTTTYSSLYSLVSETINKTVSDKMRATVSPINIYVAEGNESHKTITLRIVVTSYARTLTDKDVAKLLSSVSKEATTTLQAERI
jgi:phenylalanyl-tRNA synthetase beta chain